jgi:PKD repeat protein
MKHFLLSILLMVITLIGFGQEQCIYRIQPVDTEACLNDTAVFTAEVDTLFFESNFKFDWYYKPDGASGWIKILNSDPFFITKNDLVTTLKVNVGASATYAGYSFKCTVSDLYDSDSALLLAVNELPVISFTSADYCFGDITHFTNTSLDQVGIVSWIWELSDGSKYFIKDMNHLFATPGDYSVKLTGIDGNGCIGWSEAIINIKSLPEPEILFNKNVFCSYESNVEFYTTETFETYLWEIEGVSQTISSSTSDIVFNCDANFPTGQYKVRLTVSNQDGCLNAMEQNFLVLSSQAPVDGYVVQKENNSNLLVLLIDGQDNSTFHWMKIRIADKKEVEGATTGKLYHLFKEDEPINTQVYKYGVEVMPAQSDCSAVFYLK